MFHNDNKLIFGSSGSSTVEHLFHNWATMLKIKTILNAKTQNNQKNNIIWVIIRLKLK